MPKTSQREEIVKLNVDISEIEKNYIESMR